MDNPKPLRPHLFDRKRPRGRLLQLGEQGLRYTVVQFVQIVEQFFNAGFGGVRSAVDAVIAGLVLFPQLWSRTVFSALFLKLWRK